MGAVLNYADRILQASSPRIVAVNLGAGVNVNGTLNSVPAATVTTGASNGTAAHSGTTNYRNDVAPTNAVSSASSPTVVNNNDGSRDITLTWTYTDGTVPADGFIIFYREGTGTVLSTDAGIQLPATARSFRFQGVHQGTAYRAGIAAFRRTEAGLRITSIYQPTSAPDWRVSAITTNITADINGMSSSTLTSRATSGYDIQQKLEANGSVILTGQLVPTNTGALKAGTITWNSTTGALTGGTGIAVTKWGIIGANAGTATFTIETSTGTATLEGNISGGANIDITGTAKFAGSTNSGGVLYCGVFNDGGTVAGGLLAKGANSGGFGVHGKIVSGSLLSVGVKGENTGGRGVEGSATTGVGVYATATTGTALAVVGKMTMTNTTLVTNLNSERWNGLKAIDSQVGSDAAFTNYLRIYDYGTSSYIYIPFKTTL